MQYNENHKFGIKKSMNAAYYIVVYHQNARTVVYTDDINSFSLNESDLENYFSPFLNTMSEILIAYITQSSHIELLQLKSTYKF